MISESELNEALRECASAHTSYANCERLAHLLVIKELYYGAGHREPMMEEITASHIKSFANTSEFLKLARGLNPEDVYSVMDELLTDTIKIINPRLYDGVIAKLENKR